MKKLSISIVAAMSCAMLLAIPLAAADKAMPASARANHAAAVRSAWPPETLTGRITMVLPGQRLLVVVDKDGIPFDMLITRKTRIISGDRPLTLNGLASDEGQAVTIRFVPERRGDVAESIHIG